MKKADGVPGKRTVKLFETCKDPRITESINAENIGSLFRFSLICLVLELISLVLFFAFQHGAGNMTTLFHVSCCIAACAVAAVLSKMLLSEYKRTGALSDRVSNLLTAAFYILLSAWGTMVDVAHYKNGEQMLTFYIVQFCFLCFISVKPKTGAFLITLSFAFLIWCLYTVDGAAGIQLLNFFIFCVIGIAGNAIRYMNMLESEKNKLEIMELNKVLQLEATTDDLTKIKNRNALNRDIEGYTGKPSRVIMADIDNFKKYNDTYGHQEGDKVLSLVAVSITQAFPGGEAYRYGGDEFLIVLPGCVNEEFERMTANWDAAVRTIEIPGIPLSVSCSSGSCTGTPQNTGEFREMIKYADERLYEAKQRKSLVPCV